MQYDGILVHYAELALKGRNRNIFVKGLVDNLRRAVAGPTIGGVMRYSGRLWVYPKTGMELDLSILPRIGTVPGVANYAPARLCALDLDTLKSVALELVRDREYRSFRVRARRVFKELPLPSLTVDHEVGGYLFDHKPAKVQMSGAELEVYIEMLPEGAFVYVDRRPGPGGLPTGVSGLVACLLSGGIDSPVAAYRMQRRGCRAIFIHFHSQPFLSRASEEKAIELARHLTRYQSKSALYLVPIGELQREVVTAAPVALRVVLYRRMMLRLAATIAAQAGAKALVTGEAIGQVASQTLTNLTTIDEACPMTVLRPLIAYDKQEIIDEARRLGTYEISIQPDEDCCQLFVPRSPETHASLEEVRAAEAALDVEALMQDTIARVRQLPLVGAPITPTSPPEVPEGPTPEPPEVPAEPQPEGPQVRPQAPPEIVPEPQPERPAGRPSEKPEEPPRETPGFTRSGPSKELSTQLSTGPSTELCTGPSTELGTGRSQQVRTGPPTDLEAGPATDLEGGPSTQLRAGSRRKPEGAS